VANENLVLFLARIGILRLDSSRSFWRCRTLTVVVGLRARILGLRSNALSISNNRSLRQGCLRDFHFRDLRYLYVRHLRNIGNLRDIRNIRNLRLRDIRNRRIRHFSTRRNLLSICRCRQNTNAGEDHPQKHEHQTNPA
jgi:hypothetical protein